MSHRFDATLKDMLGQDPKDLAAISSLRLPDIAPAKALNVDLSTISAATDVAFGFGDPLQEILDLNFQSGPDPLLPKRLLLYNVLYQLRYDVPVGSAVFLLRPKADAAQLSGRLSTIASGKRVEFEYDVIRMWQQPVDAVLRGGLNLLPLATLCQMPEGEELEPWLRKVILEVDRRLTAETDDASAKRLMEACYVLTGMRLLKEPLRSLFEGVRMMQETTAFDEVLVEGELRVLLRQGTRKFGAPDPKTEGQMKAIQDFDRLDRIADAILTANSWQELLSTP